MKGRRATKDCRQESPHPLTRPFEGRYIMNRKTFVPARPFPRVSRRKSRILRRVVSALRIAFSAAEITIGGLFLCRDHQGLLGSSG